MATAGDVRDESSEEHCEHCSARRSLPWLEAPQELDAPSASSSPQLSAESMPQLSARFKWALAGAEARLRDNRLSLRRGALTLDEAGDSPSQAAWKPMTVRAGLRRAMAKGSQPAVRPFKCSRA
jgi:hypothetical protein